MVTSKTTTKAPKVTRFPADDISAEYHTKYGLILTITAIMTKPSKGKASFEFETALNGEFLGVYPERDVAETALRKAAMRTIEEIQIHRTLVEIEAAAGVPEAIAELSPISTPTRTIEYNRVSGKFDLLMAGGDEPLLSADSYLEAEREARKIFDEPPLPF